MEKRLVRSRGDRMIAGVAGGLGEYLAVDPVWIRLLFVVLLFASGVGFWAYLIFWIIMPEEGREESTSSETVQANVQDMADRAREFGESIQRGVQGRRASASGEATSNSGAIIVGLAFILLGMSLLLRRLGIFWWWNWGVMWPLLLVGIGGALLFSRLRE
jgi:phage shock protein C